MLSTKEMHITHFISSCWLDCLFWFLELFYHKIKGLCILEKVDGRQLRLFSIYCMNTAHYVMQKKCWSK